MTARRERLLSTRRKVLRWGLAFGLIGTIFVMILPSMWTSLFKAMIKLKRGTEFTKSWEAFPVPLTSKFHFFDVVNPDEAMNGEKVKVREVGPFTFEQWRRKEVIEWGPNDETIKYLEYKKYVYKPELSDDWDQEITTINPIVAGLAANLEDQMKSIPLVQKVVSPFIYSIISGVLISHGHNLFLKTTPRQLLHGHRINIFDTAQSLVEPFRVFGLKKEDVLPSEDLPNNAFGILNGKNNTPNGPFEIYTGQGDLSRYTYTISYKNDRKQNKWRNEFCDRIYGTDGAQFPPFRSKRDKLPIFTPDVCRTLYIVYEKEDELKGIPTWRMKLDPKLFEPPQVNSENECYCMHWKKNPQRCSIKGTIDLGGCLSGAPIIMSLPHFLGTEPDLAQLVDGLRPDKKKHEFYILMEPRMGVPLFAYGRMMLSIRVERTSFLRGFDQVRNAFIPFVWIEESGGVDDFLAMILRTILVYIVDGSVAFFTFLMVLGWMMFFSTFLYGFFCTTQRLPSEEHLYVRSSSKESSNSKLPHIDSDRDEEDDEDDDDVSREEDALKKKEAFDATSSQLPGMSRDELVGDVGHDIIIKDPERGRVHSTPTGTQRLTTAFLPFYRRGKDLSTRLFIDSRKRNHHPQSASSLNPQSLQTSREVVHPTKEKRKPK